MVAQPESNTTLTNIPRGCKKAHTPTKLPFQRLAVIGGLVPIVSAANTVPTVTVSSASLL
jgi:hypothetical protein